MSEQHSQQHITIRGMQVSIDDIEQAQETFNFKEEEIALAMEDVEADLYVETDEDYGIWMKSSELDWTDLGHGLSNMAHEDILESGYVCWPETTMYIKMNDRDINLVDQGEDQDSAQQSLFAYETPSEIPRKFTNTMNSFKGYKRSSRTSDTNPIKPAYITHASGGKMGLVICPGKVGSGIAGYHDRDLEKDLTLLCEQGMTDLFGLMPEYELKQYQADGILVECDKYQINYHHCGWTDVKTPDNKTFKADVEKATLMFLHGKTIGVHCRGGLGRTGTFAGCVLAEAGYHVDDIIALLKDARGYQCPQTDSQRNFVRTWAVKCMVSSEHMEAHQWAPIKDEIASAMYEAMKCLKS